MRFVDGFRVQGGGRRVGTWSAVDRRDDIPRVNVEPCHRPPVHQLLSENSERFPGGLVFEVHRLLSTSSPVTGHLFFGAPYRRKRATRGWRAGGHNRRQNA